MPTTIDDLHDLRRDMLHKAAEMKQEAARMDMNDRPDDAANLRRIAERMIAYTHDYLE
ncbi:hypothetical protein [Niveispirillum irakense]|uniref:hypothetical protein n=1 Tax=Niveispirillum irakense TaxID=34011 RepID=UPI0003F89F2A|nr:hypothetical protein [Niveispirillum irakense]